MSVFQPIYRLQELACLPGTDIIDISLEIWKCRYIIQLSISPHRGSNVSI